MERNESPDGQLIFVHPDHLQSVWKDIKESLIAMTPPDQWLPEDVYSELKQQRATLHICALSGKSQGFVVLKPMMHYGHKALHIWILCSPMGDEVMKVFGDTLNQMARQIGADRLTFSSNRRGWEKRAKDFGFDMREITYERLI